MGIEVGGERGRVPWKLKGAPNGAREPTGRFRFRAPWRILSSAASL